MIAKVRAANGPAPSVDALTSAYVARKKSAAAPAVAPSAPQLAARTGSSALGQITPDPAQGAGGYAAAVMPVGWDSVRPALQPPAQIAMPQTPWIRPGGQMAGGLYYGPEAPLSSVALSPNGGNPMMRPPAAPLRRALPSQNPDTWIQPIARPGTFTYQPSLGGGGLNFRRPGTGIGYI